jgi:hypothetical protein
MADLHLSKGDLQQTSDNIFFIVGTSRSGSTLLQSMLNSHEQITIPPETHFFHSFRGVCRKFYRASCEKRFRKELIEFWCRKKTRLGDLQLCEKKLKETAERLGLHTPVDLYNLHLTLYRKNRGKKIVGEKTPKHILHTEQILTAFPKARIISLFRDPRAVAHSEKCVQFGSPSVFITSKRWRKYVKMHHHLKEELSEKQYITLRYCDLIQDPSSVLQKISSFLGIQFRESMLQYHKREEKGFAEQENSWKNETLEPLKKDKNREWVGSLTEAEVAIIEATAGKYLDSMKYQNKTTLPTRIKSIPFFLVDYGKSVQATILGTRKEEYLSL